MCARLLVHARRDAIRMVSYEMGDTTWSVGCRTYAFGQQRMRRVAEKRTYNWLSVLDQSNHFVFLIQDVPVRFFRGSADEPTAAQRGAAARLGAWRGSGQWPGVPPRPGGRGGRGRGPGDVPRPARRRGARRVLLACADRRGSGTGTPIRIGTAAISHRGRSHAIGQRCRPETTQDGQGGNLPRPVRRQDPKRLSDSGLAGYVQL